MKKHFTPALPSAPIISADHLVAENEFQAKQFIDKGGACLHYCIHKPDLTDKKKTYPLFLVMHGAGERGDGNKLQIQKSFGPLEILTYARLKKVEVIIVAPQIPLDQQWVDTPWAGLCHVMSSSPSLSMQMTINLIEQSISQWSVDQKRIYVTGVSMGGFGTWDIIQRKPELFAAAMPICGGGDPQLASKVKHIPVWVFHGDQDQEVKVSRSRDMVAAIKKAGGKPLYTEYNGVGHNSWEQTYTNPEVLNWFFQQRKVQ